MLITVIDTELSHNVLINTMDWVSADHLDRLQEGAAMVEKGFCYRINETDTEPGSDIDKNCGFAWSRRFLRCNVFSWNRICDLGIDEVN